MHVIIVDSDERCDYEPLMRESSTERAREKLKEQVTSGKLKKRRSAPRLIGSCNGITVIVISAGKSARGSSSSTRTRRPSKPRSEGKYVIAAIEKNISIHEAVEKDNELMDVEQGFRGLKDVLAVRPTYHQVEHRVRAHILVAGQALLVQRFLERGV